MLEKCGIVFADGNSIILLFDRMALFVFQQVLKAGGA